MTATVAEVTEVSVEEDDERRPLMTPGNIAWMNLGFFGRSVQLRSHSDER